MIYSLIGKAVVKYGLKMMNRKLVKRTALLGASGFIAGITAVGVIGYLATRDVPEG